MNDYIFREATAADPLSIPIYKTAIGAGILVSDFLSVSAIPLSVVAAKKPCYLNFKLSFPSLQRTRNNQISICISVSFLDLKYL